MILQDKSYGREKEKSFHRICTAMSDEQNILMAERLSGVVKSSNGQISAAQRDTRQSSGHCSSNLILNLQAFTSAAEQMAISCSCS